MLKHTLLSQFALYRFCLTTCLLPAKTTKIQHRDCHSFAKQIDYTKLTDTTTYATFFVDKDGSKTVDLTNGANRLLMFRAINTYNGTAVGTGATLDASVLKNMFSNIGSLFQVQPIQD